MAVIPYYGKAGFITIHRNAFVEYNVDITDYEGHTSV